MDKYERFLRQIDILNPDVCDEIIYIIGAGATGSFLALSLAKMGFGNIRVFDADTIEEHNFPNQLFPLADLGKNKAVALKDLVKSFTGETIDAVDSFYERQPLRGIVISALDTMEGRARIYENCLKSGKVKLLIDPRTSPNVLRILSVNMELEAERKIYELSLHSDADAEQAPCTGRAIIYSVLLVSAYCAMQVRNFQMNEPFNRDLIIDLKNNALIAN